MIMNLLGSIDIVGLIDPALQPYVKDGILAALVIWLLYTDRQDRKEDRAFWSEFYLKNKDTTKDKQ